jgi:Protein of unknown function (DUF3177)
MKFMQMPPWLPSIVWTDYRLAVLFSVLLPLVFLIWSALRGSEAIQRLLIIYWRVSSLLAITVYLMIAAFPVSFIVALIAKILIPTSLWFWADLNEEINEHPKGTLKQGFMAWRWAVTLYFGVGAVLQIPFLQCAVLPRERLLETRFCQVWLEPPWQFKALLHPTTTPWFLGLLGIAGLIIYVLYLGHFVIFRLGKQGRSAMET